MSTTTALLVAAVLAQGAIALALLWVLGAIRVPMVASGKMPVAQVALSRDPWPEHEKKVSNAFDNQFQLPVLFYVACGLTLYLGAGWLDVALAWLFVVSRIVHMVIFVTRNRVYRRFFAYTFGYGILCLFWIDLAIRLIFIATPERLMRLPGRMAAAIEILADIDRRHRPVADALKSWGLDNRFAGSGDRAAIGNLVYDALRKRLSHAWAMQADTPRALVLSVAVRDWGEPPDEMSDLFAQDTHAPETLSADEVHRLSMTDPLADAPDHVRADLPEWTLPHLPFGDDLVMEGHGMAGRPPLDLRANTLKSSRDKVLKVLERFAAIPTDLSPVGVRIPAGVRDSRTANVQVEESFLKGGFEVQDQGSQLVALMAGAKSGEQVLDLCAGAGGKTLAIAAAMENKGQIFAHDSDRHRLAPIYDRLQRSGVRNVQVRPPGEGVLSDLVGRMDVVLIDAPCTGSGTWRRRPDAKWRLTSEQLAARVAEQQAILAEGARYVRPGGRLVYITCSILDDENSVQAANFATSQPQFAAMEMSSIVETFPGLAGRVRMPARGVLLTPLRTGTDGFYCAVFARQR